MGKCSWILWEGPKHPSFPRGPFCKGLLAFPEDAPIVAKVTVPHAQPTQQMWLLQPVAELLEALLYGQKQSQDEPCLLGGSRGAGSHFVLPCDGQQQEEVAIAARPHQKLLVRLKVLVGDGDGD